MIVLCEKRTEIEVIPWKSWYLSSLSLEVNNDYDLFIFILKKEEKKRKKKKSISKILYKNNILYIDLEQHEGK